jgi:hypothetical protein
MSAMFCVRDDTIAQVRYVAYYFRYAIAPNESFVELFRVIDPERTRTLTLEKELDGPGTLKCLVLPLVHVNRIQVIHFRGFASYGCHRLAHEILKICANVRTIIFENYSLLVPTQFKMHKLAGVRRPVNILFFQCRFPPEMSTDVINELCKFPGEYQRLNFGGFQVNANACRVIFTAIEQARCFRSLEQIGFDDVDAKAVSHNRVMASAHSVLNRSRFLRDVSFGHWSPPLNLQPSLFANSNVLGEVYYDGTGYVTNTGRVYITTTHLFD